VSTELRRTGLCGDVGIRWSENGCGRDAGEVILGRKVEVKSVAKIYRLGSVRGMVLGTIGF
jgi:hypothetical protein